MASTINPKLVGKRLRQVRQERGLSQTQLATDLEMNIGNYNEIEHGKRLSFQVKTLYRLCQALNVSADYLLGLQEEGTHARGGTLAAVFAREDEHRHGH